MTDIPRYGIMKQINERIGDMRFHIDFAIFLYRGSIMDCGMDAAFIHRPSA